MVHSLTGWEILPPLNEREDIKDVANSIKIVVKDPQNGETRCAWGYNYTLNNDNLPSGNYFIKLEANNTIITKKISLLK